MHPLQALNVSTRVAKRAQYETFEFTITRDGVRVRNCSHADPTNHEYVVTVTEGQPVRCDCPADRKYETACKHRVALAIRPPILDAATNSDAETGMSWKSHDELHSRAASSSESDTEEPACEDCIDEFPCWDCYRTGAKPLPE